MEIDTRTGEPIRYINYDDYPDLNNIPERYEDFPLTRDEIPEFARLIIMSISITVEGKRNFASKFLREYFLSERFRELTDGYIFVFVKGNYLGAFENVEIGVSAAYTQGFRGYEIDVQRMYMEIGYEYRETCA